MSDIRKARETQIKNVEARTGKQLVQLTALVRESGLTKHSEIVGMLKSELGMGHGDANLIAHLAKEPEAGADVAPENPLDVLYVGPKAELRPIHEALLMHLEKLGSFETAPKKKYVSYRRRKQFAMIGPATNTRVEVGLNVKDLPDSARLERLGSKQMCDFRIRLTDATQVDAELLGWVQAAYDSAG